MIIKILQVYWYSGILSCCTSLLSLFYVLQEHVGVPQFLQHWVEEYLIPFGNRIDEQLSAIDLEVRE